jgi:adenine/guanine phosphoribosyltransferase-like PRPP-binding protein
MSQANDAIWALLGRVGLTRRGGSLDALADPAATDALAERLAERLRPFELHAIIVWEELHGAVLGYAVGLRLGVPVVVFSDDEGLVTSATDIIPNTEAALVAATTPDPSQVSMTESYLHNWDSELVAIATLLARPGSAEAAITLAELPPAEPRTGTLTPRSSTLAPELFPPEAWR